jgi:hypothetical protein
MLKHHGNEPVDPALDARGDHYVPYQDVYLSTLTSAFIQPS